MAMGGGGSTYRSADGIWHAAIDIEPDRATGRRRRLTAQGKTKAVANARLRMKLDAYVRKGFTPNSPSPRLMDWLETWYHDVFCQIEVVQNGVSIQSEKAAGFSPVERKDPPPLLFGFYPIRAWVRLYDSPSNLIILP